MIDRAAVLAVLDAIPDPKTGRGLVAAGLTQGLMVAEDRAGFVLEVASADTPESTSNADSMRVRPATWAVVQPPKTIMPSAAMGEGQTNAGSPVTCQTGFPVRAS